MFKPDEKKRENLLVPTPPSEREVTDLARWMVQSYLRLESGTPLVVHLRQAFKRWSTARLNGALLVLAVSWLEREMAGCPCWPSHNLREPPELDWKREASPLMATSWWRWLGDGYDARVYLDTAGDDLMVGFEDQIIFRGRLGDADLAKRICELVIAQHRAKEVKPGRQHRKFGIEEAMG